MPKYREEILKLQSVVEYKQIISGTDNSVDAAGSKLIKKVEVLANDSDENEDDEDQYAKEIIAEKKGVSFSKKETSDTSKIAKEKKKGVVEQNKGDVEILQKEIGPAAKTKGPKAVVYEPKQANISEVVYLTSFII